MSRQAAAVTEDSLALLQPQHLYRQDEVRVRLGIELRRVGSGGRLTFSTGEAKPTDWMAENALVCWCPTPAPWEVESTLVGGLDLPLNLDQNQGNAFHPVLVDARAEARTLWM